jgi:hypothetical protein
VTAPAAPVIASAHAAPDPRPTAVERRSAPLATPSCVVPPNTSVIKVLRRPLESAHWSVVTLEDWAVVAGGQAVGIRHDERHGLGLDLEDAPTGTRAASMRPLERRGLEVSAAI